MPYGLIALVAFWGAAILVWIVDGAKIPALLIALWVVAFFSFPRLHWPAGVFVALECALTVGLLLVHQFRSDMNRRA